MTFRAIDPAVTRIYYAEEADKPLTIVGIPDGSLVIFTDTGLEDSFDAIAGAWFNREQIAQTAEGKTAGLTVAEVSNFPVQAAQDILFVPEFTLDASSSASLLVINDISKYRNMQIDAKGLSIARFEVRFVLDGAGGVDFTDREAFTSKASTITSTAQTAIASGTFINTHPLLYNIARIRIITTGVGETGTFNISFSGG